MLPPPPPAPSHSIQGLDSWGLENFQRNTLSRAFAAGAGRVGLMSRLAAGTASDSDFSIWAPNPDDVILVADVDEIVKPDVLLSLSRCIGLPPLRSQDADLILPPFFLSRMDRARIPLLAVLQLQIRVGVCRRVEAPAGDCCQRSAAALQLLCREGRRRASALLTCDSRARSSLRQFDTTI